MNFGRLAFFHEAKRAEKRRLFIFTAKLNDTGELKVEDLNLIKT